MKAWKFGLLCVLAAAPLSAQDNSFALGLGLRSGALLTELDEGGVAAPTAYVAIRMSEDLMIEPSVAFVRAAEKWETLEGEFSTTASAVRFGISALLMSDAGSRGNLYWGPRLGYTRYAFKYIPPTRDGRETDQRVDLNFAALFGGEFFPVDRFALGGEIGVEYTRIGQEGGDTAGDTASLLSTVAELRVRWYLR